MIEISNAELAARRHLCQHYWVPVLDRVRVCDSSTPINKVERPLTRCVLCHVVKGFMS